MEKVKLSPPWEEYSRKIMALFDKDDEIHIEKKDMELIIRVDNTDKYEALMHLLPETIEFGNVILTVKIIPANIGEKKTKDYIRTLFKGNNSVTNIQEVNVGTNPMMFVEFQKEVIQYYNDNLGDLHGNRTTVMEQIAREVFDDVDGIYFCTSNGVWEVF